MRKVIVEKKNNSVVKNKNSFFSGRLIEESQSNSLKRNSDGKLKKNNFLKFFIFGIVFIGVLVFVYATITIGVSSGIAENITYENNFSHLNLSDGSLVLYMPFDYNHTSGIVYDYSNQSNDGQMFNFADNYTREGYYGGGYSFDGINDYIVLEDSVSLRPINNFSISLWYKTSKSGAYISLFESSNYFSDFQMGYSILQDSGNHLYFYTGKGTGGVQGVDWQKVVSAQTNNDGIWHHLVALSNSTHLVLYQDGVFDNLTVWSENVFYNITNFARIGIWQNNQSGLQYPYLGSIDELMIFNRSLSQLEVEEIYNSTFQRFIGSGTLNFTSLNFGENNTVNISVSGCQQLNGSVINFSFNGGSDSSLNSGCQSNSYSVSGGDLSNSFLMLKLISGVSYNFYSPLILGDLNLGDWFFVVGEDTTPPTYSNNSVNSTIPDVLTDFSLIVNDNVALNSEGYYIFSTNNSGSWINDSAVKFTQTPQTINTTKVLNETSGTGIGYRWYIYDNNSNFNVTEIFTTISVFPSLTLYWGNVHSCHTTVSDGLATTDECFTKARDVLGFDWVMNVEHVYDVTDLEWDTMRSVADSYNEEDGFVAFPTIEWGSTDYDYGWKPYWFANATDIPLCKITDTSCDTPEEFWEYLKTYGGQTEAAHPNNNSNYPYNSTYTTNWSYYNDSFQRNVEIRSWGNFEHEYGVNSVIFALSQGRRLGIVGATDDHTAGLDWLNETLTGCWAYNLTRDGINDALFNRRCFATAGERISVNFTADAYLMGSEFSVPINSSISLRLVVNGTYNISSLEFIKNNMTIGSKLDCNSNDCIYTLDTTIENYSYIYSRINQSDEFAWSSPIFIESDPDSTPPTFTTIPSNQTIFYLNQSLNATFVGTDETSFSGYTVNDTTNFQIGFSSGFLINNTSLSAGNYSVNVSINDSSNNINWTIFTLQVNQSLYPCSVLFNESSPKKSSVNFLVYTDCSSGYQLYRNGSVIANNSEQDLSENSYNFSVFRNDSSNYTNIFDDEWFVLDDTSPTVNITTPANTTYPSSSVSISVGTNENSTCNYSTDGGTTNSSLTANSTGTGHTGTLSSLSTGSYTLNVYCSDIAGNVNNSESVSFIVSIASTSTTNTTSSSPKTGGSGGSSTYVYSAEQVQSGFSKSLKKSESVKIEIKSQERIISIESVSSSEAVVEIDGKIYSVEIDSSTKVDLNNDGVYDLEISNSGISTTGSGTQTQLEFKEISEAVESSTEQGVSGNVISEENSGNENVDEKISFWKHLGNFFEKVFSGLRILDFWK